MKSVAWKLVHPPTKSIAYHNSAASTALAEFIWRSVLARTLHVRVFMHGLGSGPAESPRASSARSVMVSGRGKRCGALFVEKNAVPARKRPRDIIRCINNSRTPVPGGLEGWTYVRIVDAAHDSSRTGEVVEVCPPHAT